ncbi:MAG: hypothetical protein FWD57_13840 [Polyangiaceae bacterium]|nr:hypothetical protein [Polyangiaceae bacterium]
MTQTDDSRISHSHILPPKNGGGPYIAACVVFALLIVGLLWFKFSPSKPSHNPPQPAQIPEPTASAEAKPAYPDFDIPAPPAINSAAADPVNPSKPATATVPNLCAGPCQGTIGPAQKSAIDATSASARGCYEQALRNNPSLEGRIVVATRIAATETPAALESSRTVYVLPRCLRAF